MSTVSIQNESLPSFEPIEQKGPTTQKRKRTPPNVKEDTGLPAIKKPRAKRVTRNTPTKSVVWIGATLSQDDSASGAFSVYYGLNDTRNCTEKITIEENQNLDYIYTMGVFRALEICQDDTSTLRIYTGSKILQQTFAQDIPHDNEIYNELRQIIEKRKGSTSIYYKTGSPNVQEEYKIVHNLSNEKLLEDSMMVDEEEAVVVDCLQVTEINTEVSVLATVETTTIIKKEEKKVETVVEKVEQEVTSTTVESSWASTLSFRNLLDVLRAPFSRKSKQ